MIKYFLILIFTVFIIEIFFNIFYKKLNGIKYKFIKKIPLKKLLIKPHPYLSYVMKKNFEISKSEKLEYLYHKDFYTANLTTNNFGFLNGIKGSRNLKIPKPRNLIRINCLGASTTGNYISFKNKTYSYPLELERILKKKFRKRIEVNNFGQGGYNSAELFIRLSLQILDTQPDKIILYHGHNDIRAYLTPNFHSDFSHSRKNFGENYWKFWIGSKIPNIPINFINYLSNKFFPSNHRYSLIESVSKGEINLKNNYKKGLRTFERNLQNLIDVSKSKSIEIILCTFCYYLHEKVKNSRSHKVFSKIVIEENKIIKKLALKNNLRLVDSSKNIPKTKKYFVDTMHFTPDGMQMLANEISKAVEI